MANLVKLKDRFDIAWGNDADVEEYVNDSRPAHQMCKLNRSSNVTLDFMLPSSSCGSKVWISSRSSRN
jgi:hypothetical protein